MIYRLPKMICGLSNMTWLLQKLTLCLPKIVCRQIIVLLIWNLLHSSSKFGLDAVPIDKAVNDKEATNSSQTLDDVVRWKQSLGMKLDSKKVLNDNEATNRSRMLDDVVRWKRSLGIKLDYNMVPKASPNTAQQAEIRQGPTSFMIGLFDELLQGKKLAVEVVNDHQTNGRARKKKLRINTVRCLLTKGQDEQGNFNFTLPELPRQEHLRMAKLSVKRNQTGKRIDWVTLVIRNQHMRKKFLLHRLPQTDNAEIQFDFTAELSSILRVYKGAMEIEMRPPKHIRTSILSRNEDNSFAPIPVIYSEDKTFVKSFYNHFNPSSNSVQKSSTSTRRKRSTKSERKKNNRRRRKNRWRKSNKQICKVHKFIVDFDLIGWGPWIIHPKTFNAKLCYGQCPSPLGHEYSPTNHAMLQSLMTMKRPLSGPSPCCVPTKLRPLSMLYFEYDDIVVRHHEDMIVDECGCR